MVLLATTTSIFLVQLLCVLVPCNPKYKLPEVVDVDQGSKLNIFSPIEEEEEVSNYLSYDDDDSSISWSNKIIRPSLPRHFTTQEKPQAHAHVVQTLSGAIEGYETKVSDGRDVLAFEGIPYAEPPVGHLRFRAPVPKKRWEGVLKAFSSPRSCMQYNVPKGFRILGTEDCLYLNIYTPKGSSLERPLPVVVFLHGGGFFLGGTRVYGPSYLMREEVILVIPQYRLGVFGFMSSGDEESLGNWGLKDQLLALKWISANIASFGGNPSSVTLFGQSAGSAMVHFHMLSRLSRPYFHKAVSLSGVAFNYWALHSQADARNYTQTLAGLIGCPKISSKAMVDCLRSANAVSLVTQTPFFLDDWPYPSNAWRPCIEAEYDASFLTESPLTLYAKGDVARVPWIVSLVSGEGYTFLLFPYITFQIQTLRNNWPNLLPDLADVDTYGASLNLERITKRLAKHYFKDSDPSVASVHPFAQIVTDRMFLSGIYKAVQAHSQLAPTYSYIFDVNGKYNMIENYGYPKETWGVGHAEDIFYILNSTVMYVGFKAEDHLETRVSRFLTQTLANFGRTGVPFYEGDYRSEAWQPHEGPLSLRFLKIGPDKATMIYDPYVNTVRFWDRLRIPDTPTEKELLSALAYDVQFS